MPVDPSSQGYATCATRAPLNNNFNYTYTSLLRALHALFNGAASTARMNEIVALMMWLKGQARGMMAGAPDPSILTGPSFEYLAENPAL